MGLRLLKIVVYRTVGALLGPALGTGENCTLVPVHAHRLRLGGVSLARAVLVYHQYPHASATRTARIRFWLRNVGLR